MLVQRVYLEHTDKHICVQLLYLYSRIYHHRRTEEGLKLFQGKERV